MAQVSGEVEGSQCLWPDTQRPSGPGLKTGPSDPIAFLPGGPALSLVSEDEHGQHQALQGLSSGTWHR